MARILAVKLLDTLTEIRFDHFDPGLRQIGAQAAFLGQHRLALDERLRTATLQHTWHDAVVLRRVLGPVDDNAVGRRVGFKHLQIGVEMTERMFLDVRREGTHLLPFRHQPHLIVTPLSQRPEPLIVLFLMTGSGKESLGRFRLIDRPVALVACTAWLRLDFRVVWTIALCALFHAAAPFRICAIWMNFMGTLSRSAQPRWCMRQELSAETIYSALAFAKSWTLSEPIFADTLPLNTAN